MPRQAAVAGAVPTANIDVAFAAADDLAVAAGSRADSNADTEEVAAGNGGSGGRGQKRARDDEVIARQKRMYCHLPCIASD